jgi:hypothetical protein
VSQKPHINDILRSPVTARVPRIELQEQKDGWVVNLVNHKHQHRSGAGVQTKGEAFTLARELNSFLDWPVVRIWREP